jgi:phosphoribosyl-ATP pyrophosphohydrolase
VSSAGRHERPEEHSPATTLYALERTIAARRREMGQPQQGAGGEGAEATGGAARQQGPAAGELRASKQRAPQRFRGHSSGAHLRAPLPQAAEGAKPSWTARLLSNPELLCKKVREEAGELCQTLEASEGPERAASEMADLLYHAMVLLNLQVRAGIGMGMGAPRGGGVGVKWQVG